LIRHPGLANAHDTVYASGMKPSSAAVVLVSWVAAGCGGGGGGVLPVDGAPPAVDGGGGEAAAPDTGPKVAVTFQEAPCPGISPRWTVKCGTLSVPEARDGTSADRRIALFVMTVQNMAVSPAPDPVVYLAGGPGESAVDTVLQVVSVAGGPLQGVLLRRNVIAIDQRGSGHSTPSLQCPELSDPTMAMVGTMMPANMVPLAALGRCHDRLAGQQIDLAQYQTAAATDDLADARVALGIASWNVLGASYGTRLALELMRRHPEGLRSVVLDSVWPADADAIADSAPNFMRALDLVFTGCAGQPACNQVYPDLRQAFLESVTALDAKPFAIQRPSGVPVMLTGKLFAVLMTRFLYATTLVRELPELIYQVHAANYSFFEQVFAMSTSAGPSAIAYGLHYSVMCADAFPFTSVPKIDLASAALPESLREVLAARSYLEVCPLWKVPPSPPALIRPVTSPLPTLLLSGQIDPVTPPSWARHAAETLSTSTTLELKGVSHATFVTACGSRLLADFFESPSTPPASACLAALAELQYSIRR
jgi:pimeloyl-ACP methyl ester carboxylesterase